MARLWPEAAAFIVINFMFIGLLLVAGPIVEVTEAIADTGDYSNEQTLLNDIDLWYNALLVAWIGFDVWVIGRYVRRERRVTTRPP